MGNPDMNARNRGRNAGGPGKNLRIWVDMMNKKVETDKNKDKMSAHLKKGNLHSLLWESNKETNFKYFFSIDFFISIALALLINWKESILIVNGFYVIV